MADMDLAGVGGTWAFVSTASANLREKKDPYNEAVAGFCAGALLGFRSMPRHIALREKNHADADAAF
jgi:Tim17/Tim22/Tim23/Pmp24 family